MIISAARNKEIVSFGPFKLVESERLLSRDGVPVELSGRALDVLVVLLARRNGIVSKKELLAQVWPEVTVEEVSLPFHIARYQPASRCARVGVADRDRSGRPAGRSGTAGKRQRTAAAGGRSFRGRFRHSRFDGSKESAVEARLNHPWELSLSAEPEELRLNIGVAPLNPCPINLP